MGYFIVTWFLHIQKCGTLEICGSNAAARIGNQLATPVSSQASVQTVQVRAPAAADIQRVKSRVSTVRARGPKMAWRPFKRTSGGEGSHPIKFIEK